MAFQAKAGRHRAGQAYQSDYTILFKKTGSAIKGSIDGVVKDLAGRIEKLKMDITDICKRREIDPNEVIAAGSDDAAINTYSMKAESSIGGGRSNAIIRDLQEDINNLRRFGTKIESYEQQVDALQRIQKNIEPSREFDLSYDELDGYGF